MNWLLTVVVSAVIFKSVSLLFDMIVSRSSIGFDMELC